MGAPKVCFLSGRRVKFSFLLEPGAKWREIIEEESDSFARRAEASVTQDPVSLTSAAPSPGPCSPSPRSPWPPDVCARCLLARALKGSLLTVPRLGPSVSSGPCLQVTAPQFECPHFSYVALCVFLVVCCNRSVLAEIPPLLTVRILKCPETADITCSLMPARASPSGICTFHTAGRGLLRENVLCCIESSEK